MHRVSVIIPVYQENPAKVRRLVASIASQNPLEIIIVDGLGDLELELPPVARVIRSNRGRGNQLANGAEEALGEVLWFVHADSEVDPYSLSAIAESIKKLPLGYFSLKFDHPSPFYRFLEFTTARRSAWAGIVFGDQGMFMTRQFYDEVGGMPRQPIMEDYELSLRLKARRIKWASLPQKILTSPRKYELEGRLRMLVDMHVLRWKYRRARNKGADIDALYRLYYKKENK